MRVVIGATSLDPLSWETHDTEDLCEFLVEHYGESFPANGRIYHKQVSESTDVTPADDAGIKRLQELDGPFFVIEYPHEPNTIAVTVIAFILVAAAAFLLKPKAPNDLGRQTRERSPNNQLSERRNTARVNQRIPDVFGTVRAYPDLLSVPLRTFNDLGQELEDTWMCVGRGAFAISDIREGLTPIANLPNDSVTIHNNGNVTIDTVERFESANGQEMFAPNSGRYQGTGAMRGTRAGNGVRLTSHDAGIDFRNDFEVGDTLRISNVHLADDHDFTVSAVTASYIQSSTVPTGTNVQNRYQDNSANFGRAFIEKTEDRWRGPFNVDACDEVIINLVANSGLFKDDGTNQNAISLNFHVELSDSAGTISTQIATIRGRQNSRNRLGFTIRMPIPDTYVAPFSVRVKRDTNHDYGFTGTQADTVLWRDLYTRTANPAFNVNPGGVYNQMTLVRAVTTFSGEQREGERRLNMLVTRTLNGVNQTKGNQIVKAVAKDPFIGNRVDADLDLTGIDAATASIDTHFGNTQATEFSYTFDSSNLSFEETLATIAQTCFCTAYRQGRVIKLKAEIPTENSVLMFNHRNKQPGSETRSVSFGNQDGYDGVLYQYVDPMDDAVVTLSTVPNANNPHEVESIGVRNKLQAYFHAWRIWQKIQYQVVAVEFQATQEAELLVLGDRILVTDNTRAGRMEGEVVGQDGLVLTLSQEVGRDGAFNIFLQLTDGTIQSIAATPHPTDRHKAVLSSAPRLPLVSGSETYARTGYITVVGTESAKLPFIVTEKEPENNLTFSVRAINYDSRYYDKDDDLTTGVINTQGNAV